SRAPSPLVFSRPLVCPAAVQQGAGPERQRARQRVEPAVHPYRSVLYMPGSRERALEKARSLTADALILDLEDAVAPAEKPRARDMVAGAVEAGGYGPRKLIIRINGLDTEWGAADLARACRAGPDAILLPKVEHPGDIARVAV